MCPLCVQGEELKKKQKDVKLKGQRVKIQNQVFLYEQHKRMAGVQRTLFSKEIQNLNSKSCLILMDFKQNFKLGNGPVETSHDFYYKKDISLLGFQVYKKTNGLLTKKNYNFLSENLSHDSFFVKNCIDKLIEYKELDGLDVLSFWSDCGRHFRSGELQHYLLKTVKNIKKIFAVKVNYFVEYHGKSEIDGHFGLLSRWKKQAELQERIDDVLDLVSIFMENASNQNPDDPALWPCIDVVSIKPREEFYKKLVIEASRNYLCLENKNGRICGSILSNQPFEQMMELEVKTMDVCDIRNTRSSQKRVPGQREIGEGTKSLIQKRIRLLEDISGWV